MIVFLQSIVAFMLVLGPLVFIHEFGHFIVAKWFGIGVPVFSLGFGPRLFGVTRGGTDYRVSAIPLGGYVRLQGDEADEHRHGAPEEFLSRPKWQRFFVFVAGATFNVFLALVAMWMLFAIYGTEEVPAANVYPTVVAVSEEGAAARAGLERGDVLLSLGGRDLLGIANFRDSYNYEIALAPNATKELVVERDGNRVALDLTIDADPTHGHGASPGWGLSWGGDQTPVIVEVYPDTPAEQGGLHEGDRVRAAGTIEPVTDAELRDLLEAHAGRPLTLVVERESGSAEVTVVPEPDERGKGKIGVTIGLPTVHRSYTLVEAARESIDQNLANSMMLFHVLKRMITREVPLRSVSGPIGIAQYAREALLTSPRSFLWLLGFFSLQLGILNLLPIPVLDGGHILILSVEGLFRRELSERIKERVMQVGFVFLMTFMGVVIYFDILKL